ncbi:hypothetical protein [Dyadobacter alkalitolerans]|uniref:hypothetical protein n=1 Tax=Dyadobacter alkalitolerans TaxID=492736 RepID=UPI00041E5C20|nr:hypothetical protein [Dyadobacter alkalitolerans]
MACLLQLGCQDRHRTQQLNLREQQIFQKEKDFSLKQASYQRLLEMQHDLLAKKERAIQQWPQEIEGIWRGKSVCKESNCPEYVIGDKRSYIWEFISDSTGLYTLVSNHSNQVIRVYNAHFDSTGIRLFYESDALATRLIELNVDISRVDQNLMTGMQTIRFDNACKAKLSLNLSRDGIVINQ